MSHGGPDPAILAAMRIIYQPIMRLDGHVFDHAEVLARMAGEDGAMQGPAAILDAMAGKGLALPITLAIMRLALADYRVQNFAQADLALAFNLPLDAMLDPALGSAIAELGAQAGISPRHIRFELTETSPVQDFAAAAASIITLHEAGYHIALDDITPDTPYLAALMALPLRAIKFSNLITANPDALPFIRRMAGDAAARGMETVAEGIETAAQLTAMRAAGVTHGQGYFFSRPVPAAALTEFLASAA